MPTEKAYFNQETKTAVKKTLFQIIKKRLAYESGNRDLLARKKIELQEKRRLVFNDFSTNLKIAKKNLAQRGFEVFQADKPKDFAEIFEQVLGTDNQIKIVKSKTNVGKEVGLNGLLSVFDWSETDLGDFLTKLLKSEDQHYVLPAFCLSAQKISEKIKEIYGVDIPANPKELTIFISKKIRKKIVSAEVGITGANFFTVEGNVLLLENEGNISLVSRWPKKHIIICSIDKLTASLNDALDFCLLAANFGTGQSITQYISIISGPAKTADIEGTLVQGAQGPEKIAIILYDGGRSQMLNTNFTSMLHCIGCGSCLNFCPVFHQLGKKYGGENYAGSRGLIMDYFVAKNKKIKIKEKTRENLYKCTLCGNCKQNCPLSIDLPSMVRTIRETETLTDNNSQADMVMRKKLEKFGNPFGEINEKKSPDKLFCC